MKFKKVQTTKSSGQSRRSAFAHAGIWRKKVFEKVRKTREVCDAAERECLASETGIWLEIKDGRFVMNAVLDWKTKLSHSLSTACTSKERLVAHLNGFCENVHRIRVRASYRGYLSLSS